MKQTSVFAVAILLVGVATADLAAQNRTTGTGLGGGTFGIGGDTGGFGGGGGGFGTGSFGSGSFGSGIGSGSSLGGSTFGSQSAFSTGLPSGEFVGRSGTDFQQFFDSANRSTEQFFQRLERATGGGRDNQRDRSESRGPPIRVKLRVGFDYRQTSSVAVNQQLQTRLRQTLSRRLTNVPQISVTGRTVTLRGSVTSDYDRLLVEKLAKLEPGVSEVDNQLVVDR